MIIWAGQSEEEKIFAQYLKVTNVFQINNGAKLRPRVEGLNVRGTAR